MAPITEEDVRIAAKSMGYELSHVPKGYQLTRDHEPEKEIIIAHSLELIADFLKH